MSLVLVGLTIKHLIKYTLTPDVNISIINDQFDRMRNVFVDWIRISTGIGSDGALSYRSQTSCDFSIIALGDTNDKPLSGYTAQDTIIKSQLMEQVLTVISTHL